MRTSINVGLQIAAIVGAVLLRVSNPGWMLIIAVITVVPLIVAVCPLVLALVTLRRGRLQRSVTVPFAAAAAALVALAAVYPEADDQADWVPLAKVFGLPSDAVLGAAYTTGTVLLLVYLATVLWTGIAIATTRAARPATGPQQRR